MNPKQLIAIQFALWAFFFSGIIPFSGDFLLPIVWIYDKKVFMALLIASLIDTARVLPGAIATVPPPLMAKIPAWFVPLLTPFTLVSTTAGIIFTSWIGAFWVKRRMKKLAPDLQRFD